MASLHVHNLLLMISIYIFLIIVRSQAGYLIIQTIECFHVHLSRQQVHKMEYNSSCACIINNRDVRITWDILILENLPIKSPRSMPTFHMPPVRQDRKSSAHCNMFSMMLATCCVS